MIHQEKVGAITHPTKEYRDIVDAKDIFFKAIEIESTDDRRAFLDSACNDDALLRKRVEALLAAHDDPDSYLAKPAAKFDVTQSLAGSVAGFEAEHGSNLSDSSMHGRFLPGTKVADRYRIVSLLGRGGMGEVYRADDLRLDQPVALKFLPPELAKDKKRLDYFHNEVKLARQISHPNVCRVYDIGEVDGQHFISMEYIDGEDLKVLIKRIGRLPRDKAVEISQQLCSALAAAHAKGVLHRDLKPANIMIDGNGQVRITDFGLASASDDGQPIVGMSGTPGYMAPEQLLQAQTSIQSDIYSLGLVLFELTTGKPRHSADSVAELRRMHQESSGSKTLSDFVEDADPALERAIARCLDSDPANRPASVSELAASLPGGDPLAAAIAAGETPSPELIAASGSHSVMTPRAGLAWLVAILVVLCFAIVSLSKAHFVNQLELPRDPEVFVDRAQKLLRRLGYPEPVDFAHGFESRHNEIKYPRSGEEAKRKGFGHPENLNDSPWPGIRFWYREADKPLFVNGRWNKDGEPAHSRVRSWLPHTNDQGMVGIEFDHLGRLRSLRATPIHSTERKPKLEPPKWEQWFPEEVTVRCPHFLYQQL